MWTNRRNVRVGILLASCLVILVNLLTYTGPRVFGWSLPRRRVYAVANKDISAKKWQDWSNTTIKKGTTLRIVFQNDDTYFLSPTSGNDEAQILAVKTYQMAQSVEFITKFKVLKESFFTISAEPSSIKKPPVKAGSEVIVKGASGDWLFCQVDPNNYGWLKANALEIPSVKISQDTTLSVSSDLARSDTKVTKDTKAKMLGNYGNATLIEIEMDGKNLLGWVPRRVVEVQSPK